MSETFMWVSLTPKNLLERYNLVLKKCAENQKIYKDVLIYRQDYKLGDFDKLFQNKIYESKVEVASAKYY